MGLFVDELCSSVIVTHVLYKTALAIAIMRWVLSWAIWLRNRTSNNNNSTTTTTSSTSLFQSEDLHFSSSQHPCPSTQLIREALIPTTFGEFRSRLPNCPCDTCAVCLSQFTPRDEVRELRNCCHVFHRECLDKWLDHGRQNHHDHIHHHQQHKTCPLCRSPFLTESQTQCLSLDSTRSQPSWAVERLLYLFGDDLLL